MTWTERMSGWIIFYLLRKAVQAYDDIMPMYVGPFYLPTLISLEENDFIMKLVINIVSLEVAHLYIV